MNKINTIENSRNIEYYETIDKVFWVVANDIKDLFKQYESVPCLFVEVIDDKMKILRFDYGIEFDDYKYTAWRKVIGKIYNIRVEVLLIKNKKLYDLKGNEILFESLERSDVYVDRKYLGIIDIK